MKNEFTKNLKRIMFDKGITQKELAKKLRTTQSFISAYQTGARNPKFETIEKIAKALNVSVEDLTNNMQKNKKNDIMSFMKSEFAKLEKRITIIEKEIINLKIKK